MRKSEDELVEILDELLAHPENECVEFKEAKNSFSTNELGKYFSALSNEAALKYKQFSWIVFGVKNDDHSIVGTNYQSNDDFNELKMKISDNATEGMTFIDIYTLMTNGGRIIMFQVPAAMFLPTTWKRIAYGRSGESLIPLENTKVERIKNTANSDWSRIIVKGATIDDLDEDAILLARENYKKKYAGSINEKDFDRISNADFLAKTQAMLDGKITNAAMLLLGKSERSQKMDNCNPVITWKYYKDGNYDDYEHFSIPFIVNAEKARNKIRSRRYRYIVGNETLFPNEVDRYGNYDLRELLNNSIVHQDYRLRREITIVEYDDKIEVTNGGSFIPGTIENVLKDGFSSPYSRNRLLSHLMIQFDMVDIASSGIKRIFLNQRRKYFPMPDYDFSEADVVKVTLYGEILNSNYTLILAENEDLDFREVCLLDRVQKNEPITLEESKELKRKKLIEGRYPHVFPSVSVASVTDQKIEYINNSGLDNEYYKNLIIKYIQKFGGISRAQIDELIIPKLPSVLPPEIKKSRVHNLITALKNEGIIINKGTSRSSNWVLKGKAK